MRPELVKKLRELDLNSYEAKLWLALLAKGSATAGELSEMTGVPRSRCYDVLESLEKKGFILSKLSKPMAYLALAPEEVFENLKRKAKEEAERQFSELESLKSSQLFKELNMMYAQNKVKRPEPILLKGKVLKSYIANAIEKAKDSIAIATAATDWLVPLQKRLAKAASAGISVRLLSPTKTKLAGLQRRYPCPINLALIDGSCILFLNDAANEHCSAICMDSGHFANLFELLWSKAES